jgi:hypothetical protein
MKENLFSVRILSFALRKRNFDKFNTVNATKLESLGYG